MIVVAFTGALIEIATWNNNQMSSTRAQLTDGLSSFAHPALKSQTSLGITTGNLCGFARFLRARSLPRARLCLIHPIRVAGHHPARDLFARGLVSVELRYWRHAGRESEIKKSNARAEDQSFDQF